MKKLVIGTRGSLLARTQSTYILNELEKLTGIPVELKKITTQGDKITDVPLWQIDGKDFFTKELDQALLAGEVDLLVHSYKDLGSKRPEGIALGAITKRVFPEDILLIKNSTIKNLSKLETIEVGTSSPRRINLLESSLSEFIPHSPKVKTKFLRGNVNTRIKKLVDGQYDAICLAFAGIERLTYNQESLQEITELVKDLNFMILPASTFPAAASQGSLAIEYLGSRTDGLKDILAKLHHKKSADAIAKERALFESYGGGCHLAVGIHVKPWQENHLIIQKGEHEKKSVHQVEFSSPFVIKPTKKMFIGLPQAKAFADDTHLIWDEYVQKEIIPQKIDDGKKDLFCTSTYCFDAVKNQNLPSRIWVSGNRTFKYLAKNQHWVNGSADGLGHQELQAYSESKLLPLFGQTGEFSWQVLSHDKASSDLGPVTGCYRHLLNKSISPSFWQNIKDADFYYWTSFSQFSFYKENIPEILDSHKVHACGPGKTYNKLAEILSPIVFTSMAELKTFTLKGEK